MESAEMSGDGNINMPDTYGIISIHLHPSTLPSSSSTHPSFFSLRARPDSCLSYTPHSTPTLSTLLNKKRPENKVTQQQNPSDVVITLEDRKARGSLSSMTAGLTQTGKHKLSSALGGVCLAIGINPPFWLRCLP